MRILSSIVFILLPLLTLAQSSVEPTTTLTSTSTTTITRTVVLASTTATLAFSSSSSSTLVSSVVAPYPSSGIGTGTGTGGIFATGTAGPSSGAYNGFGTATSSGGTNEATMKPYTYIGAAPAARSRNEMVALLAGVVAVGIGAMS